MAILFEVTMIVSVKFLVSLGPDMLFETFPELDDAFLLFCRWASRVLWARVEISILHQKIATFLLRRILLPWTFKQQLAFLSKSPKSGREFWPGCVN